MCIHATSNVDINIYVNINIKYFNIYNIKRFVIFIRETCSTNEIHVGQVSNPGEPTWRHEYSKPTFM